MTSTFKLYIIRYRFMTFAIKTCSRVGFYSFCLICLVSVVFLGEFVENDRVLAQEKQTLKCPELSNPNSSEELKELRDCLQKIKFEIENGRRIQKIQRSYEGSLELVKQLNLVMDKKTSKQISVDSLNNNSADQ